MNRSSTLSLILTPIVLLFSATAGAQQQSSPPLFHEGTPELPPAAAQESGALQARFPDFSALVGHLSKAVVNISVEAENAEPEDAETAPQMPPFLKRDPEQQLFSLGSGFIVSPDGYIVTNAHVIEKAKRVVVRLLDDRTDYEAKVVGKDVKTDLALLKMEGAKQPLEIVYIGDSDKVEVGEWAIAIGNQFQLGQTVTAGIISAKSRRVPSRDGSPYDSYIQTDASINPGSSGGPLFNTKGQVIGINTAIFSPGRAQGTNVGFNIGIGFAVPINLAKMVVPQLQQHGKVTRGLLGVIVQQIDKDMAQALGLPRPEGALVADVMPESPASKAGFKRKDIVVKFEGHPILDYDDLPLLVANTPIGTKVAVQVLRAGKTETLNPVIDELKDTAPQKAEEKPQVNEIGLSLAPMSEAVAKALNIAGVAGVVVENVVPGSTAYKAGIARGDVIEEVGGQVVTGIEALNKMIKALPKDKPVLVLLRRKDGTRFVTLKP